MYRHVLNLLKFVVIEKTLLKVLMRIYGQIRLRLEHITIQLGQVTFDNTTY